MKNPFVCVVGFFVLGTVLPGCSRTAEMLPEQQLDVSATAHGSSARSPTILASGQQLSGFPIRGNGAVIVHGRETPPQIATGSIEHASQASDGYILNFENVEIRDVVKAVLGDMLQLNYTVDPNIHGNLTLHTATPLAKEAILPAFEDSLKLAGVALIESGSGYAVIPLQDASHKAPMQMPGGGLLPGYRLELIPLKFAAAADVQRALEPVAPPGAIVRIDPERNTLLLAGTNSELAGLVETVSVFDVDWLRTQSFGLFPLQYSRAKAVATDLRSVVGNQGPMAGLVRIVPIDHLNAILVASSRASYVSEMQEWIERFDRGGDSSKPKLFFYRVQNGRAADIEAVLEKLLGNKKAASPSASNPGRGAGDAAGSTLPPPVGAPVPGDEGEQAGPASDSEMDNGSAFGDVRITTDEANNALLILATPERYEAIEAALRQIDIVPLQVLLEASIAEVTLTNQLQYGLQYYFQKGSLSGLQSNAAPGSIGLATGGLSLAYIRGSSIQATLDLLSTITKVRVISSPKLLVLNNRTASLQVGDEVPIATSSAVSVQNTDAPVVNTIQLLDTGVILRVTPRVNSGGLVLMDVSQEVSASVPTTTSQIDSPTIQQRKVASSVAVQDGQTIALGGLISDSRTKNKSGVPWLDEVPVLGNLFGTTTDNVTRTELLVLITPHVVYDQKSVEEVTNELRAKLPLVSTIETPKSAARVSH